MTNETNNPFNGSHSETGFTGRTANSYRAEARISGRNAATASTGPATYSRSDMPVSAEVQRMQAQQQGRALASQFYDHSTNAPLAAAGVHSDYDPAGFLAAHGFKATDAQGNEVQMSPRQARGLIGRYMDSLNRGGGESVSFRDDSLPAARSTVYLRSIRGR